MNKFLKKDVPELHKQADQGPNGMLAPEAVLHYAAPSGGEHTGVSALGEHYGAATSIAASAIAGAALGAIVNKLQGRDAGYGASVGAQLGAVGGGLAHLGGFIGAGISDRRTAAEQKEHDDSTNVAQWFVPGMAPYNRAKRIGRQLEQKNQEKDPTVEKKASALAKEAALLIPAAIGAGATHWYHKNKENKIRRAIDALVKAGIIGGGTYAATALLDPEGEHQGKRALGALAAAAGSGALDLHTGAVSKDDLRTAYETYTDR